MSALDCRAVLAGAVALARARPALAQPDGLYESLSAPGRIGPPRIAASQRVFGSPARKAADPGRWVARAPLPVPRSEMAATDTPRRPAAA